MKKRTSITSKGARNQLYRMLDDSLAHSSRLVKRNLAKKQFDYANVIYRGNWLKERVAEFVEKEVEAYASVGFLEPLEFVPASFCGAGWEFDPNEPQDAASLALTHLDPLNVVFESFLTKGENVITGEERLARAKAQNRVRLDARWFMALWKEGGHKTLEWFHKTQGVTWVEFLGSPLRDPDGRRCSLVLSRDVDGTWLWNDRWLVLERRAGRHAAVLES